MSDFFRKYWFVVLFGVCFIGVLIYFIVDTNKDNVSAKNADGQNVVVSTELGDVTSQDLYDASQPYEAGIVYNSWRNAVIDQTVETTKEIKEDAKSLRKAVESNIKADTTGQTKYSIEKELASYGFTGENALEDYARIATKVKKLDADFVKAHFDELKDLAPTGARTISYITMVVDNKDILTDEAKAKQEEIQKALDEGKSFAEVAKEYSEDEATKDNGGQYGYLDSSSTDLDSTLITQVVSMKNGETSDWIAVQPKGMLTYTIYKVHIDETDATKIMDGEDEKAKEAMVMSMLNTTGAIEGAAISEAAEQLEITYENDEAKKEIEDTVKSQLDAYKAAIEAAKSSKEGA